jgi:chemotaxis-related protein WspD
VNIRGVIRLCVSLRELLGVESAADTTRTTNHNPQSCLVVIAREGDHWVMLVDEIYGIERFPLSAIRDAPVTVAKATPRLTRGVIGWQGKGVGYLDDELLFLALRKDVL